MVNFFIFKKKFVSLSVCVRLGVGLRCDWTTPRRAGARDRSSSLPSVGRERRRRRSDAMRAPPSGVRGGLFKILEVCYVRDGVYCFLKKKE